jgi:hypothetical protein
MERGGGGMGEREERSAFPLPWLIVPLLSCFLGICDKRREEGFIEEARQCNMGLCLFTGLPLNGCNSAGNEMICQSAS